MKKIVAIVVICAFVSAYYGVGAEDKQNAEHAEKQLTGRVFEDAKTEDGRYDLSVILASANLPQERKDAFSAGDLDQDGFLTQEEYDAVLPDYSQEDFVEKPRFEGPGGPDRLFLPFMVQGPMPPGPPHAGGDRPGLPPMLNRPHAALSAFKITAR